ncbi:MAG: hypothetical protein LBL59_09795 [Xanthomonadaceae bacterium]|nr:hypothetical protein [Xanthomonadaceae bacterium]
MPAPEIDQRRAARSLYWQGWRVGEEVMRFEPYTLTDNG